MSKADDAKASFQECLQYLGDRVSEPEKFNLYEGLASLADAVKDLQRDIDSIKRS